MIGERESQLIYEVKCQLPDAEPSALEMFHLRARPSCLSDAFKYGPSNGTCIATSNLLVINKDRTSNNLSTAILSSHQIHRAMIHPFMWYNKFPLDLVG